MKIVFITREGYHLSGARVRCYNFASELRKYGVDTRIFSFADTLGAQYGEKEFEMGAVKKLRLIAKALRVLLQEEKETVFFIQRFNYHAFAPFLASLLKRYRVIFDCDDWNIREDPRYYWGFIPSSKMEYLTRRAAGYSHICIAASSYLKKYLEAFNRRVYYVPTAVDTRTFRPGGKSADSSKTVFSWIGTAYQSQMGENLEFILECFSLLPDYQQDIVLEIAGEGRYLEKVKGAWNSRFPKQRARFLPWISPDKVPEYLAGINVGLLPLIQDSKFNRSKSPTKLFEYMAMGKAVLSSDIGEAAEVIRDGYNGLLARSKEEFVGKMNALIKDRGLRDNLGSNALKTARDTYSLESAGKRLFEIVNSI